MEHCRHFEHHEAWMWIFPSITMVLVWLVLITILVLVWRWGLSHQPGPVAPWHGPGAAVDQRQAPEQVLADRLARSEIDIDEYHQRLAALRGGPAAGPPGVG